MAIRLARPGPGRPQKFGRPSRALTLTLPEDVIAALTEVDDDVSRAIVRITQSLVSDVAPHAPAELATHGNSSVIVIKPVAALERIPGVTLVPLPDGRALISLDDAMSIYEFELKLRYAMDDRQHVAAADRAVMASITDILKSARQTRSIALHERRIIVLETKRRQRGAEPR